MARQRKRTQIQSQTLESFLGDKEDQNIQSEQVNKVKEPTSKASKKNMNWSQAMEELKKNLEKQVREVEEKLGREMRRMRENHEKQVNDLLKETQKNTEKYTEENNTLKNRLTQMAKELQKANEEKNALKGRISQMEKEVQRTTEENTTLKIRLEQVEASDFMRNQDIMKQNQRNEKNGRQCQISHWESH